MPYKQHLCMSKDIIIYCSNYTAHYKHTFDIELVSITSEELGAFDGDGWDGENYAVGKQKTRDEPR